jgi:hypothetical protein
VLHVTFEQDPLEQACPEEQVCFNFAVELLEQLEFAVPGLLQVFVI